MSTAAPTVAPPGNFISSVLLVIQLLGAFIIILMSVSKASEMHAVGKIFRTRKQEIITRNDIDDSERERLLKELQNDMNKHRTSVMFDYSIFEPLLENPVATKGDKFLSHTVVGRSLILAIQALLGIFCGAVMVFYGLQMNQILNDMIALSDFPYQDRVTAFGVSTIFIVIIILTKVIFDDWANRRLHTEGAGMSPFSPSPYELYVRTIGGAGTPPGRT